MREIMFRGKTDDIESTWVYGDLYHVTALCFIRDDEDTVYLLDEETVGQYTGIKDRVGTKIFEGDIIRFYDEENNSEDGVVFWNGECSGFYVEWVSGDVGVLEPFDGMCSKVIGNKWDGVTDNA